MAWWDHEELKAPEHRSDRYKVTFPEHYTREEVDMAQKRLISITEKEFYPPKRYTSEDAVEWKSKSANSSFTKEEMDVLKSFGPANTTPLQGYEYVSKNVSGIIPVPYPYQPDEAGTAPVEVQDSPTKPLPTGLKFREDAYLDEIRDYLASTYEQHYAKGNVQTFELIASSGQAEGFTMGSIMKYASRYGKKNGYNRKDLLKIIHYAMLQLYVHDKEGK